MRVLKIPCDSNENISVVDVEFNTVGDLWELFGENHYAERVNIGDHRTRNRFPSDNGFLVMYVDEDGHRYDLNNNDRATTLYNPLGGALIVGDAYVVAEALVPGEDGLPEYSAVNLPEHYQDLMFWNEYFSFFQGDLS